MSLVSIFFIAFSLSLDAFAVSVTAGASHKRMLLRGAVRIALAFGLFQMLMPILGWFAGLGLKGLLCQADHWVAFILLSLIGAKMIFEAVRPEAGEDRKISIFQNKVLFLLGIATSIDALVAGFSFVLLGASLYLAAPIIGAVTFAMCILGVCLGKRCGHIFENKFEIIGGLVLLALGLKILLNHLFF